MTKSILTQKRLFSYLDECFKKDAYFLIITLPGLGVVHSCRDYAVKNQIHYVNSENADLESNNIIYINSHNNPNASSVLSKYSKAGIEKAGEHKTIVSIINSPTFINSEDFNKSEFSRHIYSKFYAGTWQDSEILEFINNTNKNIDKDISTKIVNLSGGIIKIAKYLTVNIKELKNQLDTSLCDLDTFKNLMLPLTEEIFRCDESTLEKLNIKINNKYRSNLVKRLVKDYKADHQAEIHLTLNKDLTFNEDEETAENRLTETEYNILKHLLNNILITREEIAQIKWGKESADKYSYWAINKTISRINNKLKIYKITAIPKVGYQITKNGSIS